MHSVSPVRIRTQTDLSNPMTSINFEEHLNNKPKKKTVQIGSSTILNKKSLRKSSSLKKSSSSQNVLSYKVVKLSPLTSKRKKTSQQTELQKSINSTNCSTCIDAKMRSKSADNLVSTESSLKQIESFSNESNSNRSPDSSPPCWSPCTRRRVSSHSPCKPNDLTYTMCTNINNRSHSCDNLQRNDAYCFTQESLPHVNLNTQNEIFQQKLIEVESTANRIASQLSFLKDFIKHELVSREFDPTSVAHLERNRLLDQLDSFELINRDLKAHLYEMNSNQLNNDSNLNKTDLLMKQIETLEAENHEYKRMISDMQNRKCCNHSNEAINLENLNNLKQSLEDNRAHLRRQLIAKEAEISRLNVQLRNALRKCDQTQNEIDMLKENNKLLKNNNNSIEPIKIASAANILQQQSASSTSLLNSKKSTISNGKSQPKLVKKYFNLDEILSDPVKTKLYIDKLNIQLIEKDTIIKDLNEKINSEPSPRLQTQNQIVFNRHSSDTDEAPISTASEHKSERAERHEAEKLRKENEKLKKHLQVKEEKLKSAEAKIKNLDKKNTPHSTQNTISASSSSSIKTNKSKSQQSAQSHVDDTLGKHTDDLTSDASGIQRTKNFSEQELNNVRSRLQQRLNELEPLPELLKNTELKLRDALTRLENRDLEIAEYRRTINDLKRELELNQANHDILMQKFKDSLSFKSQHKKGTKNDAELRNVELELRKNLVDDLASTKLEPIERRLKLIEEENKDLRRQLSIKDDMIQELSSKLATKTNDAIRANRQLELTLTDLNTKEQQLIDKQRELEKSLNSKCLDLESRVQSMKFELQHEKRDKEEQTEEYKMQIKDLKARLDQTLISNKQMTEYVNFLKNSYIQYFNENVLRGFESSNNLMGGI